MSDRATLHPRRIMNSKLARKIRGNLTENYLMLFGAVVFTIIVLMATFAPLVAPYDPTAQDYRAQFESPSVDHPMGTDRFGRDIFSRVVYGARLSIQVGIGAILIAMLFGVPLGLLAGYYRGHIDEVIMRIMDVLFAFPAIFLALGLLVVLGQSTQNVILALGIVYIPIFARVTRSGVLGVREEPYVLAARAIGDTHANIIRRDILPNIIAPIIVQATISLAFAILAESGLSFIGLGTPPPTPSWGRMLSESRSFMQTAWWWAFFPGVAIMLSILSWNFIGDGLRDALDPRHDTKAKRM